MGRFPKLKIFRRLKIIGCGCLVIFLILVVLGVLFSGVIIRKLISGAISSKTGVQVNIDGANKGNLSYTDPKTGATLNIGSNKIPDSFPKDFPIYPGSAVTSSWSANGFGLTLTSSDSIDKISAYYENALAANGWIQNATAGTSWAVSKANLSGVVTIEKANNQSQTSILIVLGEGSPKP